MAAKRGVSYKERISGFKAAQRARSVVQLPFPIRKGLIGLAACAANGEYIPPGRR